MIANVEVGVGALCKEALADRHSGTLGGRLATLGSVPAGHVSLVVSRASASCRAGQLLLTHTANLVGRLEGVVASVSLTIEGGDVRLLPTVDPREPQGGSSLASASVRASVLAHPDRFLATAPRNSAKLKVIRVGIGAPSSSCDIYVAAGSWGASVGCEPVGECRENAQGAIGALTAASFATAEVFRMLRVVGKHSHCREHIVFNTWSWSPSESIAAADLAAPDPWGQLLPAVTVVGVGAVGCAMLFAVWASGLGVSARLVDGDFVALTNLNRYVLFALSDVGASKVERAAKLLGREAAHGGSRAIGLEPVRGWWSDYVRNYKGDRLEKLVVSGVDTNTARHQLQDSLPEIIVGASTLGLRLELSRYDVGDPASRCLKCFNRPEAPESDLLLQRRLLALDDSSLARYARESGVDAGVLAEYVADLKAGGNGCAILAGPSLDQLRRDATETAFAVSFVSNMAGVQLATQVCREAVGEPLLIPPMNRAIFQFLNPAAESNRVFQAPRDPGCWCMNTSIREAYREIWGHRFGGRTGSAV